MAREVRIGLLAVVTFALTFWGYKFILGRNLLVRANMYQAIYDHVGGLTVGTRTYINGVDVGSVASIELLPDDEQRVLVRMNLNRDVFLPKDTRAVIAPAGVMGGMTVNILYQRPCTGSDCLPVGSFIKGETQSLLSAMLGIGDAGDYVELAARRLQGVLDSFSQEVLSPDSDSPIAESIRSIQATLGNLNSASAQLDGLMRRSSGHLERTVANVDALTGTLSSKRVAMGEMVDNANALSAQLAQADIGATLGEVKTAVANLQVVLSKADQAMTGLNGVVGRLEAGEGTLGKMLTDDSLYEDLSSLSAQIDSVMADIQDRPYRYVPFKSRSRVLRNDRKDAEAKQN